MEDTVKKLILALGALMLAQPAMAQVTLNVTSWAAPGHPMPVTLGPLCEDIKQVTEGRVACNILPRPVADASQTFDAVRDGIADMGYIVHGYNTGRFPLTEVAELPLMGDTAEVNSAAYYRIYTQLLSGANEHEGVVLLSVNTHGPGQIYNIRRDIKMPTDLAGLKMRVGSGTANNVATAVGAVPILKPATEVYELLSGGVIDGVLFAKDGIVPYNLAELIKHVTFVPGGFYNISFGWIANPDKWNSIPESDRALIEPLLGEALARRSGRAFDVADKPGEEALKAANIPITVAGPEFIAELESKLSDLEQKWIAAAVAKGVDGEAALSAIRAEIEKVSAGN